MKKLIVTLIIPLLFVMGGWMAPIEDGYAGRHHSRRAIKRAYVAGAVRNERRHRRHDRHDRHDRRERRRDRRRTAVAVGAAAAIVGGVIRASRDRDYDD